MIWKRDERKARQRTKISKVREGLIEHMKWRKRYEIEERLRRVFKYLI